MDIAFPKNPLGDCRVDVPDMLKTIFRVARGTGYVSGQPLEWGFLLHRRQWD